VAAPAVSVACRRCVSYFSNCRRERPAAAQDSRRVLLRDITTIEGIRDNPLIGYSIVVGLKRTGDSQQTQFTTQALANVLQRLGAQITAASIQVRNVAAVMVTASLPPFARPGTALDVTVSSLGDAKSLEGGVLLLTSLHGADGQVYAQAQGPLTLGGYTVGGGGNSKEVNHVTVGECHRRNCGTRYLDRFKASQDFVACLA